MIFDDEFQVKMQNWKREDEKITLLDTSCLLSSVHITVTKVLAQSLSSGQATLTVLEGKDLDQGTTCSNSASVTDVTFMLLSHMEESREKLSPHIPL